MVWTHDYLSRVSYSFILGGDEMINCVLIANKHSSDDIGTNV